MQIKPRTVLNTLYRVAAFAGICCLFAAGLVTAADILMRPFGTAIFGVVDLVQLMVMAAVYFAIPYAFLHDGHVGVDLLSDALPRRMQAVLRAVAALASAGFMTLILVYGWEAARQQLAFGDVSQTIGIPLFWYWLPLLLGAGLSILATLVIAFEAALGIVRPPSPGGSPRS